MLQQEMFRSGAFSANYGSVGGLPLRYTDREAWVLHARSGRWVRISRFAGASTVTAALTQAQFDSRFGTDLPPLPSRAFQAGGK
jgi:hypothetical protein